jgi:3-carboxy-cis,cis-muconate cycloisomerase
MATLLRDRAAFSADMMRVFSDESLLAAALQFEAALATAEAAEGLIPVQAAERIRALCANPGIDIAALAEDAAHAGTLAISLVAHLRARSQDAACIHLGATSQDVGDTALMLQAKDAAGLVVRDLGLMSNSLADLARIHADTPMLGRTLLQAALPISFGLKAANWLMSIDATLLRFRHEMGRGVALQFGGATGTRAGLDGKGAAIAARMAAELGLACPPLPWQARRDGIAGLAAALAIITGTIGKIARDIALLAQGEVAEAFEPRVPGRGGSSAMAHKRNPTGCQIALSAALRTPGLAATIFAGMAQEHERGLGGWQAEAPVLAELFCLTHGAITAMLPVLAALDIDPARMAENLRAADVGTDMGESASLVAAALTQRDQTIED